MQLTQIVKERCWKVNVTRRDRITCALVTTRHTSITVTCTPTWLWTSLPRYLSNANIWLTWRESVGMPMEVVSTRPMTKRKRIPMAKTRLRFENGMTMTIIDWHCCTWTHGLILLPLEVALLGFFIRATTCDILADVFSSARISYTDDAPLFEFLFFPMPPQSF